MSLLWYSALCVVGLIFLVAVALWAICAIRDAKEALGRQKKNYGELSLIFVQLGMIVLMICILVFFGFEIIGNF